MGIANGRSKTSSGIRGIISLSSSYYNSLDSSETNDRTQIFIRPRFLQMLVLLQSLLNDEDLAEIQEFVESTYSLKADPEKLGAYAAEGASFAVHQPEGVHGFPGKSSCNFEKHSPDFPRRALAREELRRTQAVNVLVFSRSY